MKNYLIETTTNGYFVHVGDTPYGGPYKNEESAKRRIRNLKAKDAAATGEETAKLLDNSKPATHEFVETSKPEPFPALREIATGKIITHDFAETVSVKPTNRPVGCYPAISKHAYQR